MWTAAPHRGTACWPTLPERDQFEHSQNSAHCSITPSCQNRGPAKDEMEPPPFGDGKIRLVIIGTSTDTPLQWGHRLSAMERPLRRRVPGTDPRSFNGATAFRRWKGATKKSPYNTYTVLQWGHRLSAMERSCTIPKPAWTAVLQWGHRLSAMESRHLLPAHRPPWRLQWGHRLSAMERASNERRFDQPCPASMGPPPFGDGNRPLSMVAGGKSVSLQWGHRLSAMERGI